jgi:putative NADPH-quinone reductase
MSRRTLVFLGHPDQHSYCGAMAERAVEQALAKGDDVELLRLADLHFSNPVPRRAEDDRRLEPDVARFQEAIRAADHLVFIFPIWWGGMPGRFKLLLELALTPGFAFQYIPNSIRWTRLLNGKTAELLVTMDTPPWFYRTIYRDAGISPQQGLRIRGTDAEERGLPQADDAAVLAAMATDPILIERPLVETDKGVRLCRPQETVHQIL